MSNYNACVHWQRNKDMFPGGENLPDKDDIDAIHHSAHEQCFIANSVKSSIKIEPR
ncbi:MAG: hypothetical protein RL839_15930 [Gammaproteobacteria bacterium]